MSISPTSTKDSNRLGQLLLADGLINSDQLNRALELQRSKGGLLGVILMQLGTIDEKTLADYLAKQASLKDNGQS